MIHRAAPSRDLRERLGRTRDGCSSSLVQSDRSASVGDLRIHLESDGFSAANPDHVRERHLDHDLAPPPADTGVADRKHATVGCLDQLPRSEVHLVERLVRQALPFAHAFVAVEYSCDRRVGRVSPLDCRIEDRDDPLDPFGLIGLVSASHYLYRLGGHGAASIALAPPLREEEPSRYCYSRVQRRLSPAVNSTEVRYDPGLVRDLDNRQPCRW